MLTSTAMSGTTGQTLEDRLKPYLQADDQSASVARTLLALAAACADIAEIVSLGPLAGALGSATGGANVDGDDQKELDVRANDAVVARLTGTPTAYFASEEEDVILTLDPEGRLAVAVDPLDGSSNIDANVSIGTIFSILPASSDGATASFFRPGREQLAAGYALYGPHTALVITLGAGVDLFVLDPTDRTFRLARPGLTIAPTTKEFAINASNYRHWLPPVKSFIDDCLAGAEGPRGRDFNMRWIASLVAETHRIFSRGGVFLYPADMRPGYEGGRLRLLYEAAPIAMLAEQAGGGATDGYQPILDKVPSALHERTPLIFGSSEKIARLVSYHTDPNFEPARSPLFGDRGLFRA